LIGPSLKKNETIEAPQNRSFYCEVYSSSPLAHRNIGERRKTFANAYGIKMRCCGKHVEEHIGNLGNIVGSQWEPGKNEKKSFHPPNLKGKKARQLECMLGLSHWLHEICLPKRVCHHFWPGLIHPTYSVSY
jgi:hypothetical protein